MKAKTLIFLLFGTLAFVACGGGGEKPKTMTITKVEDRNRERISKIELIVKDEARADEVKRIYLEIEELAIATRELRTQMQAKATQLGPDASAEEAESHIRSAFAALKESRASAYPKYIELQMELRRVLTEEEFIQLNGVR